MNTLLLRLSGAMQAWGVQSRFGVRDTGREPSKSGVLGLICAALGIDRCDDHALSELSQLRMGVRVEHEGNLKVDYQTAKNVLKAGGGFKETELSNRYYLADALFLAGLESEDLRLLERIQKALKNPVWPLFLGRKAFIPGELVWLEDGLKTDCSLEQALKAYPFLGHQTHPEKLRGLLENAQGNMVRIDQPLSFQERRFAPRRLSSIYFEAVIRPEEVS